MLATVLAHVCIAQVLATLLSSSWRSISPGPWWCLGLVSVPAGQTLWAHCEMLAAQTFRNGLWWWWILQHKLGPHLNLLNSWWQAINAMQWFTILQGVQTFIHRTQFCWGSNHKHWCVWHKASVVPASLDDCNFEELMFVALIFTCVKLILWPTVWCVPHRCSWRCDAFWQCFLVFFFSAYGFLGRGTLGIEAFMLHPTNLLWAQSADPAAQPPSMEHPGALEARTPWEANPSSCSQPSLRLSVFQSCLSCTQLLTENK